MKFIYPVIFYFKLFPILIFGWFKVLLRGLSRLGMYWSSLGRVEKALFVFLFLQMFFSLRPWLVYKINFTGEAETVKVSAKLNLYSVILSVSAFFISAFYHEKWKKTILGIFQGLNVLLFSAGLLFPSKIFSDFIEKSDYGFSPNLYLFAAFSALSALSVGWYFKTES